MAHGEFAADVQAEAGAGVRGELRIGGPEEPLEDSLANTLGDADAVVFDLDDGLSCVRAD